MNKLSTKKLINYYYFYKLSFPITSVTLSVDNFIYNCVKNNNFSFNFKNDSFHSRLIRSRIIFLFSRYNIKIKNEL